MPLHFVTAGVYSWPVKDKRHMLAHLCDGFAADHSLAELVSSYEFFVPPSRRSLLSEKRSIIVDLGKNQKPAPSMKGPDM